MTSQTISHYRILDKLGAGGMGEVYLAEDTKLNRKVAIKFLPAELTADEQAKKRLVREAQAAARLDHPNICSIYEVAEEEGRSFIVMQYVEGETLAKLIQRKPPDLRESLDIAAQVADALAEAHAHQIIHRDIKPQNIMITARGQVKVLDFGLARVVRERPLGDTAAETESLLTDPGMIIGTVPYMSPEQVRGEALDARSDIFSFGSVLYEMMSGICPFAAQSAAATVSSILTREPPPLARYSREMPEALEWIVSKALRKDREQRYQTARDLLIDLKNLKHNLEFEAELERSKDTGSSVTQIVTSAGQMVVDTAKELAAPTGEVAAARTTSSVGHLFSQANQHKRAVALALGALAALAALWYLVPRPGSGTKETPKPIKNVNFTQLTDQPGQEYFPSLSPDGKSLIYVSRASGNWDIYLQRVGGRNPTNLTKDSTADDTQPAFSPDGERIVFRSEREGGGIYLMGATGESVKRVSDFGYNPVWSPDGEEVLLATESVIQPSTRPTKSQLWTIDVSTGDRHLITEGDALQPHWSPHGHRIAYWSRPQGGQGDVWTISADGSSAVRVTSEAAMDWNPVWSPDGKYLYFCSDRAGNMGLWRVPIEEKTGKLLGEAEAVTSGAGISSQHISFAQDGRRMAYVTQEEIKNLRKVTFTFDPSTEKIVGEPVPITRGSLQAVYPDPSPDGEWLAYYSMGKQQDIFIIRTDGSGMRQLTDDAFKDRWPHWSPDGKRIAFTSDRSGSSQIWAINRDGSGLQQLTQMAGAHYPVWSPDGTQMAYSIHTPKNDCYIFRVGQAWGGQTPVALAPLSDTSQTFESWSWSPDGKRLAGIRHLADGSHVGIGVYDLESQKYDWLTDFGEWPSWFNDGRRILFANHGKIFIVDSESKKYHEVLPVADGDIGSPGLSRDNRMIYFTFVATEADIWLLDLEKGG